MEAPQGQDVHNLKVNNMLLANVKQWDTLKIEQLFSYNVVKEIMKVSLLEEVSEDCLVWKEEKNGVYSVKTRYKLWMQVQSNQKGRNVEGGWCSLWKIKAPPKTKHLL